MARIDDLRKRFPQYAGLADHEVVDDIANRLGEDPLSVAKELGVQINQPGFVTGFKSGLAGFPEGVGRLIEDTGVPEVQGLGRGLRQYGEDVQFRNPTTVHSFEDLASSPWQGFKEFSGQAIGSTLPTLIPYAGLGARAATLAGAGLSALPSYAGIRSDQEAAGETDVPSALLGAGAVGAIEQIGGVQSLLRGAGTGMRSLGLTREALSEFGRSPLRTAVRSGLRTATEEGLEEVAQNPIEQQAAGQDPFTPENLGETAFSGVAGFVGSLPFGGIAGARRGMQHSAAADWANRVQANPADALYNQSLDAIDVQHQVLSQQVGSAVADQWRGQQLAALQDRYYQGVVQGMAAGQPTNLLDVVGADNGQLFDDVINPFDVGGQVSALQRGEETDPMAQQYGLFGGGGMQPIEQPAPTQNFQPLTPGVPMQALPHSGQVMPQDMPVEEQVSRAAAIMSAVHKGAQVIPTDQQWAEQTLKQHLGEQGFTRFVGDLGQRVAAAQGQQTRGQKKVPGAKPQAAPFVQMYKDAGGIYSPVMKAFEEVQTPEQALEIVRARLENKNTSQKVLHALEEMHKKLSGKTYTQYLREQERADAEALRSNAGQVRQGGAEGQPAVQSGAVQGGANLQQQPQAGGAAAQQQAGKVANGPTRQRVPARNGQKVQAGPEAVQGAQAPALPSAGSANSQESERQVAPRDPAELRQFLLGQLVDRDPKKALAFAMHTGWHDGNAYNNAEIGERLQVSKERARQLVAEAQGIVEGIVRRHGIRPEQFRETDPYAEETAGPAAPISSLATKAEDAAAAGIVDEESTDESVTRNTGYTVGPMAKVNSSNITGEVSVDASGNAKGFTPDAEGQANERAEAFAKAREEGDVGGEAAAVWDNAAFAYSSQGEKMAAFSDTQPETQRDWEGFYAEQKAAVGKSDRQKDAAIARKLREYLKRGIGNYANQDELSRVSGLKLEGVRQVIPTDNQRLAKAIIDRFKRGYGAIIRERLEGVYVAEKGMRGDAMVMMTDNGKYAMVVRAEIWQGKGKYGDAIAERFVQRMFQHELEHIVDNSAMPEGEFSSDEALEVPSLFKNGGPIYEAITAKMDNPWVEAVFSYPLSRQYRSRFGPIDIMKELYAQIMSLYHVPSLAGRLRVELPDVYAFAEATHDKIRSELAKRVQEATRQEDPVARAEREARERFTRAVNTRNDGIAAEPRVLFKAQGAEGYAAALGRVEAELKSGDGKRIAAARTQLLNLGRTPVVLRAIMAEDGSKPFRKTDFVVGTGATVYLKARDLHSSVMHGGAVPMDVVRRLPELLADPVAVFKSGDRSDDPNSYKVLINAQVDGRPVIVALKPNHPIREARGEPAHFTVTIFPHQKGWRQPDEWAEAGLLRYYDDQSPLTAGPGNNPQGGKSGFKASLARNQVVTKSQLEQTPPALWSKGLDEVLAHIKADASTAAQRLPKKGDVLFSKGLDEILAQTPEVQRAAVTNTADAWAKLKPTLLTLHQLVDQFGSKLASLKDYVASMDKMEKRQQSLMNRAHNTLVKWQGLHGQTRHALNGLMRDATMQGIHPDRAFDDPLNAHVTDRDAWQGLSRRYNQLDPAAKEIYQEVRKVLDDNWQARKEAFASAVSTAYNKLIADAAGDAKRVQELESERDKEIAAHAKKVGSIKGPYFPLLRFGDYLMIAESDTVKGVREELENATGQDATRLRKQLETLKRDPRHYVVEAHESRFKAERAAQRYGGMNVRTQLAEEHFKSLQPVTAGAVDRIGERLEGAFDKATAAKLKQVVAELYISTLPEHAALQRQLRRQGIEGATSDLLRAVAQTVEKDSFYLSRMEYADEVTSNLFKLKQESKKAGIDYQHVYNNLQARAALDFAYQATPVQTFLARMSGIWHLGMSPAYLLTNSTQPWMITAPVLAGKFGLGRSLGALRSAYADAARTIVQSKKAGAFADIRFDALADPQERAALKAIMDRGQIDITQNVDLGLIADGTDPRFLKLQKAFGWANHHIEATNRIVSGLAAYRLARGQGMSHQDASDYAFKTVVDTQLNYTNANAAYWMKNGVVPLGKLIFQFRKYQQGMMYLLARNAQLAFQGDREALRALGYLAATQFMMAGAVGIPTAASALWAAGLFFGGGDDEKGDLETQIRNYLADTMGPDAARVFWKGLPTMLGLDVSKRIGMGDIFSPLPYLRLTGKTGSEQAGQLLVNALGAPMGMLANFWDAAKYFEAGDWQKAAERALPKMFADIVKADRYAGEGVSTRSGTVTVRPEQIDGWDVVLRAAGFSPMVESEHYEAQSSKENVARAIDEKRRNLLAQYANARLAGRDLDSVLDQIDAFNERHPDRGHRIDRSAMLRAVQSRKKGGKELDEAGVRFQKKDRSLRGIDRYAFGA